MSDNPTVVANYDCQVGECPLWHPDEHQVYWTDQFTGRLFRYDPETDTHEQFYDGDDVTGFTLQEDGSFLLFMDGGAVKRLADGELTTVIESVPELSESRFNDVIADPDGRVFCGTQPAADDLAYLYRLDTDGELTTLLDDVELSNGLGFSPALDTLYLCETMGGTVYRFDYDRETGALSDQSPLVEIPQEDGMPDGLTVDTDGYIWVALYGGQSVVRFAPDGTEDRRIEFPTQDITSLTFGGPSSSDLYVTSAAHRADDEAAGALFRVSLDDVGGSDEFVSAISP
jgi:sugar lactone lactonase YvrE